MGYERCKGVRAQRARDRPLAFMRGRTLNNAFRHPGRSAEHHARADEDVPHPPGLWRQAVVTGDVSQIDLPKGQPQRPDRRGARAQARQGIAITRFTSADVVRHPLVARIVDAYDAQRTRPAPRA